MPDEPHGGDTSIRPRRSGLLGIALAVVALAVAAMFALQRTEPGPAHVTMTAGEEGTTLALVAHRLAAELPDHGVTAELVETGATKDEIASLRDGKVDLALASSLFPMEPDSNVREVAPMHVEALHLLVKEEIADSIGSDLTGLRGRSIDLGEPGSATASLARAVLAFSDVREGAGGDGYRATSVPVRTLEQPIAAADRDALPDAIFHLATVPSLVAQNVIVTGRYRLVPLPFAEAFRLNAMLLPDPDSDGPDAVERRYTMQVSIPAFTYQRTPAVPAVSLPTLGVRLVLFAREDMPPETVERVLAAVFDSHFANLFHPPLDRALLVGLPTDGLHAGTIAFIERSQPALTQQIVDELNNVLSIIAAVAGAGIFLMQGLRARRRAERDAVVADAMTRIAAIERRIVEIELSADMDLETLMTVQRELLQLKSETLDHFTSGEIGDQSTLGNLLNPLNAARDHVGELLLHVRDSLEGGANKLGRSAEAVWDAAAEKAEAEATRDGEPEA